MGVVVPVKVRFVIPSPPWLHTAGFDQPVHAFILRAKRYTVFEQNKQKQTAKTGFLQEAVCPLYFFQEQPGFQE